MNKYIRFGKQMRTVAMLFAFAFVVKAAWAIPVENMTVTEVTFGGTSRHDVISDHVDSFGMVYPTPHWVKDRGFQSPVCYTRNTKLAVSAKFTVLPDEAMGPVKVRASSGGYVFPEKTLTIADKAANYSQEESNNNLPNHILGGSIFAIKWEFYNEKTEKWEAAGSTANQLYAVMYNDPLSTLYHTVLDLSCRSNDGQSDLLTIAENIWTEFASRSVKNVNSSANMAYWPSGYATPSIFDTGGLLFSGQGRCGAWTDLFKSVQRVHQIPAYQYHINLKSSIISSFVAPPGHIPATGGYGLIVNSTLKGQSNDGPRKTMEDNLSNSGGIGLPTEFFNHDTNKITGITKIFDPSYGGAPVVDGETYEGNSISGFYRIYIDPTDDTYHVMRIANPTGLDTDWTL